MRKQGYTAEVVEKYNYFSRKRNDLFGMFDILAFKAEDVGALGVQTTSGSHTADRKKKIMDNPFRWTWINAENRIQVHGWRKMGKKGKRKTWEISVYDF